MEDPGLPCRWEVQPVGPRLPLHHGGGKAGPGGGRRGSEESEW